MDSSDIDLHVSQARIEIKVVSAVDLPVADFISSDPYCNVKFETNVFKTQTIMKTLNPVWNEETSFPVTNPFSLITFEVWDWDKLTADDHLGRIVVSLDELPPHEWVEREYKLEDQKNTGRECGTLTLQLRYTPDLTLMYPVEVNIPSAGAIKLEVNKDITVEDLVVLVCKKAGIPNPDFYSIMSIRRVKKVKVRELLLSDDLPVKVLSEWVLEEGKGEQRVFALRRIVLPGHDQISAMKSEEVELLFVQVYLDILWYNQVKLLKHDWMSLLSNEDFASCVPPDHLKEFNQCHPPSEHIPVSVEVRSQAERIGSMRKFLSIMRDVKGSLTWIFRTPFFQKVYRADGTSFPNTVNLGIRWNGIVFLHTSDNSELFHLPWDRVVLYRQSSVTFEFADLRGNAYLLVTKVADEIGELVSRFIQAHMKLDDGEA
eukprot:TRINITY_DN1511_c0_g1_i2.p1 TRINITY_DN1511_c0_g1~~TRINITY_DN1511_c0_g1_i2.p1  ORF type:complete len:430 (+),score=109.21 TRINITY_DN1511_c0_g1_i2:151-1440(+)